MTQQHSVGQLLQKHNLEDSYFIFGDQLYQQSGYSTVKFYIPSFCHLGGAQNTLTVEVTLIGLFSGWNSCLLPPLEAVVSVWAKISYTFFKSDNQLFKVIRNNMRNTFYRVHRYYILDLIFIYFQIKSNLVFHTPPSRCGLVKNCSHLATCVSKASDDSELLLIYHVINFFFVFFFFFFFYIPLGWGGTNTLLGSQSESWEAKYLIRDKSAHSYVMF